jgi:hypothetical protein
VCSCTERFAGGLFHQIRYKCTGETLIRYRPMPQPPLCGFRLPGGAIFTPPGAIQRHQGLSVMGICAGRSCLSASVYAIQRKDRDFASELRRAIFFNLRAAGSGERTKFTSTAGAANVSVLGPNRLECLSAVTKSVEP